MLEIVQPAPTINLNDAIIYVVGYLIITTVPLLITMLVNNKTSKKNHKKNNDELVAIKSELKALRRKQEKQETYIKDKGVDDFCAECKKWEEAGYITPVAFVRLKVRYKDLGELGADGERDDHWEAINLLDKCLKKD